MSHFPGFHRLFYRGPEHRAPFPGTGSRESFQKQVSPMPPGAGRANMERGGDAYDCAKANVLVNLSWALHRREAMRFIRN